MQFYRSRFVLFIGCVCALVAMVVAGRGDGLYVPFSMPATTCTNQFVRTIATITGAGTCASVANADLTNSSVTVNGTTCTLGSTCVPAVVATKITAVNASSTITRATGIKAAIIECVGAGGGGAGAAASATGLTTGGGGGSGSYSRAFINAPAASYVVTIGASGAGGTTGANNGTAGGDTSVVVNGVTVCVGKGGSAGMQNGSGVAGAGGNGGVAGTGDFSAVGNQGEGGIGAAITTINVAGPAGGAGPWGGATRGAVTGGGTRDGSVGNLYGAGGGGGAVLGSASTAAGGASAAGGVIITELTNQ